MRRFVQICAYFCREINLHVSIDLLRLQRGHSFVISVQTVKCWRFSFFLSPFDVDREIFFFLAAEIPFAELSQRQQTRDLGFKNAAAAADNFLWNPLISC